MSRFSEPQDPLFRAVNASISVDYRLAPYDLEQSVAHARMLARCGIIGQDDLAEIERGLGEVREEIDEDRFEVRPEDEDVHMAIERRLIEIAGPVGGKLQTGRSRNDQVATDLALFVADRAAGARRLIAATLGRLLSLAEEHREWRLPGYTHLQRAQPVSLAHHLLAWFWMLRRDADRFASAADAASVMPLGSGALAGVNWELDREAVVVAGHRLEADLADRLLQQRQSPVGQSLDPQPLGIFLEAALFVHRGQPDISPTQSVMGAPCGDFSFLRCEKILI
jgi:argininosuccinate lyase